MEGIGGEHSQPIFIGGYETDEMSLTSTAEEEGGTYEMEEILSEAMNPDGKMVYLLKWLGYPLNQCTWEPEENLDDPEITLMEWAEKKAAIDRGETEAFDTGLWFAEHEKLIQAKRIRKKKREKKRMKMRSQAKDQQKAKEMGMEKSWSQPNGTANPVSNHSSPAPTHSTVAQAKPIEASLSRHRSIVGGFVADDGEETDDDLPLVPKRRRISRQASSAIDSDIEYSTTSHGQNQRGTNLPRSCNSSFQKVSPHSTNSCRPIQKGKGHLPSDATSPQGDKSVHQDLATGTPSPIETSPDNRDDESPQNTRSTRNVLDNWTREPPRRFRQRANPNVPNRVGENGAKNFRLLSTSWRYQSYARNEPPPDMSAISWTDNRTGKPIENYSTVAVANTAKPKHPEDGLSNVSHVSGPSPITRQSKEPTPQLSRESVVLLARKKNKIPMTCYNWHAERSCSFSDEECRYFHVETGQVGSQNGMECSLPKYAKPPLTCFFWYENRHCKMSDDSCVYAHWNTGLVADIVPGMPPREVDKSSGPRLPSGMTCFFWSRGKCHLPESRCKFEHRWCTEVALPPRNWEEFDNRNVEPTLEHRAEPMDTDMVPVSNESYQSVNRQVEAGSLKSQSIASSVPEMMPDQVSKQYPRVDHAHIIHLAVPSASNIDDVVKIEAQLVFSTNQVKQNFRAALDTALATYRPVNASQQASNQNLFRVDRSIMAEDLKKFSTLSPDDVLFHGDIFPTLSGAQDLDQYSDGLVLQTGAALTYFPSIDNPAFTVIMCPPSNRVDAWRFLSSGRDSATNAVLQFVVAKPLSKSLANMRLTEISPSSNPVTHAEMLFSKIFKKNLGDLFVYPSAGIPPLEKNVLLMFPHTLTADIQFVSSIFEAYGCQVFLGHLTGAFHYFLKEIHKGIVVFHPFFLQFHKIPNLSSTLLNKKYNFHEIGPDRDLLWGTTPREELAHHWLFPHGGVVFLTDHVIEFAPKEAFNVILQFTEKRVRKAPFKNWRLFLRPGVRRWAWELAERHRTQAEYGNDWTRFKIAAGIEELMGRDPPLSEDGFSDTSSDENLVISPSKRMMPEIGEWWEEGIEGKEKATEHMVQYFCGWVIAKVREFRRFIIVHPTEKPEWRQKYQHISLVTPEKYTQKF